MSNYRFASWGLGVQSTYMILLSALGGLPKYDAAIFADTGWERKRSYETFEFYKPIFEAAGIKVIVASAGNIRELGAENHVHMPFWTDNGGPLRRQCTRNFKIRPVRRAMRAYAGYSQKPPHPKPGEFELHIGFSLDEWERMKDSTVQYIVNKHPLIDLKINRWDCESGYRRLGYPIPVKSSCVGCPYRDAAGWLLMQHQDPAEFEEAVSFDRFNRNNPLAQQGKSIADNLFVWYGLKPLDQVDFESISKTESINQLSLFDCQGELCHL